MERKKEALIIIYFFAAIISFYSQPVQPEGRSQTEAYLQELAPTRDEAYAKIKAVLTAPDPQRSDQFLTTNPKAFEPLINQAIEIEKKHPDYYALYHATQKEGMLLTLLRTYIAQQEQGWIRNDFFILRNLDFFYGTYAQSTEDYIKQNIPLITEQYHPGPTTESHQRHCVNWQADRCRQFDLDAPYRNHLISTSPAFVAGIDDTDNEQRNMSEMDYAAWESSFYYFATNLSWSSVRRLYSFLVADLKRSYPTLFENTHINNMVRKYIAITFNKVVDVLFPHPRQKLGPEQELYAKAGMAFQFLIPKNIIDDIAYLAWANGILWQRTINNIKEGWNEELGAYTKLSPILEILRTNPKQLGRSIHLIQGRLILKDRQYFYDPSSPIKMRLIHSLPISLFRVIEDYLRAIAYVVVENNRAQQQNNQQTWFEQTNIEYEVKRQEEKIQKLLASSAINQQIEAMNLLYYFVEISTDLNFAAEEAFKRANSSDSTLRAISSDILKSVGQQWTPK